MKIQLWKHGTLCGALLACLITPAILQKNPESAVYAQTISSAPVTTSYSIPNTNFVHTSKTDMKTSHEIQSLIFKKDPILSINTTMHLQSTKKVTKAASEISFPAKTNSPSVTQRPTPKEHPADLSQSKVTPQPAQNIKQSVQNTTQNTIQQVSNSSDLYWLSHVIQAEAGGQPMSSKLAVGEVIMNRLQSPDYPKTIQGVIFQQVAGHYAFTCVENGWLYQATPSASTMEAAKQVLAGQVDIVPNALVFYVNQNTPANNWVRSEPTVATIGSFTFAQ